MSQRKLGKQGRPRTADNRGGTYLAVNVETATVHPGRSSRLVRRAQEHKRNGYDTVVTYPDTDYIRHEKSLWQFWKRQEQDGEDFTVDNR